jgi:hypothetical protein
MCHDKYNFATDITNIKFVLCEITISKEIKRNVYTKKKEKQIYIFLNRTGIV